MIIVNKEASFVRGHAYKHYSASLPVAGQLMFKETDLTITRYFDSFIGI